MMSSYSLRAVGFVIVVLSHLIAGWYFQLSFQEFSGSWQWQFYLFLSLSLLFTIPVLLAGRRYDRSWPTVLLCAALPMHIVLGYPQGPDLTIEYALTPAFVAAAGVRFKAVGYYIVALLYPPTIAANQFTLRAWGSVIEGAAPSELIVYIAYGWLVGLLIGLARNLGEALVDQEAETSRLDRTVEMLSTANLDFQDYATAVRRKSTEEERKRMAREIHDTVGYTLMNLQMMMEASIDVSREEPARLPRLLTQARDQAHEGLLETRRAMRNLRALNDPMPKGMRRIEQLVRVFESATQVRVRLNYGNAPSSFGQDIDSVVYRVIQESLTNSFRHGNASEVTISFWIVRGELRLAISDNGRGADQVDPGVGLEGMQERLRGVNGQLRATGVVYGFQVVAEIPLPEEEDGREDSNAFGG